MCYHSFIIQKTKKKERKERNDQLIVVNILWEVNLMSPSWEITEQKGHMCVCSVAESCLTLCNSMDCSPPGSSVLGIFQARILEWVALLQGIFLTQGSNPCHLYLLHWQFCFFFLPLAPKGHVNLPPVGSSCSAPMLSGQWTSLRFIGMGLSREARQAGQLLLLWSVRPCPLSGEKVYENVNNVLKMIHSEVLSPWIPTHRDTADLVHYHH